MSTQNKNKKVLSWNIREMNDSRKWPAIRNTIEESTCIAFCFQETKKNSIDPSFLKKLCPRRFNKFEFHPLDGASGGLLTVWNGSQFFGELIDSNRFALTVKLTSLQSGHQWFLTNVYGPCSPPSKAESTNWLYNLDTSSYDLWMMLGDFNLIRSPDNRNRPSGNTNDMMLFNDIISHLDLVEVPLKNRAYTWSNMQQNSLLEKLDLVFTSSSWTTTFPNTLAYALSHAISDHVPYVVQMESMVPKAYIFRFENYWITFPDFLQTVQYFWNLLMHRDNHALILSGKLKVLRRGLKAWSKELSKLNKLINNSSYVLALLDGLKEQRPLSLIERNFRKQLKTHLLNLLEAKIIYW
jgi:exonuclease III